MDNVGKRLRSARIEKGYTLDDLQQITKIQKRYLIAIEEGNFDQLPGDFYVRAFIKQYAETVGLDSADLLDEYHDIIPETQPTDYAENSIENKTRALHEDNHSIGGWFRDNLGKIIIGLVALIVIASLYFYAVRVASQPKTQIPDESSQVVSSKSSSSSSSQKSSSKKSSSKSSKSSSKKSSLAISQDDSSTNTFTIKHLPASDSKLTLNATGRVWVMVTLTGGTGDSWQSTLSSGESHDVALSSDVTSIKVQTGNAPEISLKINNKDVSLRSSTSVVQTYTFNIESSSDSE
ncbi:helix-turn-helix domain-containing protein [Lapidilactobacillus mulanensis]|uniref:Helix-turn-helix domain-containing protein n=1 Tax=Lapidilactobacillus mulanensis TaxID=2485999 RepID=A0ABW4DNB3_9LACO|nr:RodZ domain-containing protein [Lapidilactobacillus mulanensis]